MFHGVKNKVYLFHRDPNGALGFVIRIGRWRQKWKVWQRGLLLLVITFYLILKIEKSIRDIFIPAINKGISAEENVQANFLIYLDSLFYVLLILLVISVLAYWAGCPEGKRRLFLIRKGRPIWTFLIYTPLISSALILGPGLLSQGWSSTGLQGILPHSYYISAAVITSFCFGLSFADIAAKPGAVRWWSLPFLLIPVSSSVFFPLLWWNALTGWFPSRYWSIWRPVLLACTILMPILAYPVSQPFFRDLPSLEKTDVKQVGKITGYGMQKMPGSHGVYISCVNSLQYFKRLPTRWIMSEKLDTQFGWDEASFDFNRKKAYVYDGNSGNLHIFQIEGLGRKSVFPVPYNFFPFRTGATHQAYDPKKGILAIGEDTPFIVTLNVDPVKARQSLYLGDNLRKVTRMISVPSKGELLLLTEKELLAYNLEDLRLKRSVKLPGIAHGFCLDQENNRVYVSFPKRMRLEIYSLDEFIYVDGTSAPAGARPVAIDHVNNLLFIGSISGILEIRDMENHSLINRIRLAPWIRRIEVFPQFGEIMITSRSDPIIWNYQSQSSAMGIRDWFLYFMERIIQIGFKAAQEQG